MEVGIIIIIIYQAVQCFHIFLRPFNNYSISFLEILAERRQKSILAFNLYIFVLYLCFELVEKSLWYHV